MLPEQLAVEVAFAGALLDPACPPPPGVGTAQAKRFGVYRNNVTVGLIAALEANFPAIRRLLGADYFTGLTREFIRRHPPQSPLLFTYGETFADFLAGQGDLAAFPYLPDVARIEQHWRRAYHAADETPVNAAALASFSGDELAALTFVAHPALAILSSNLAAHSIFSANRSDAAAPVDWRQPEICLVTRPQFEVLTCTISPAAARFFALLCAGQTLADAAGTASDEHAGFDVQTAITLALTAGCFCIR